MTGRGAAGSGESRPRADQTVDRESKDGPPVRCDLCGGAMLDRHCRLICLRCGYQRDCSDP